MTNYDLAKQIPAKYRRIILDNNHIYKAVLEWHDYDMMQLWFYWANFIEPDSIMYKYDIRNGRIEVPHNLQCRICLTNLKNKWILLEPYLVSLEQDYNLLKSIK